ncbi:MgtC/SapB transporter [Sulfurovum sp. TSL6]|uniref:MgtC/SapB family protein n=1 Tax=Sulfurovum sp. TSL6 TaxID=2826995 RepID=UPI001CC8015A|nr:MgtC/SapB family protein [Sulfurovum sp. TSL6]GIU00056.1 MgtC/SapB transporter [Sulfurovum sp. TSL6]
MELDLNIAKSILLSVLLGFSIGLQREISFALREENITFTGARSFAIISLLGVLAAYFKANFIWITIVITFIFGALLISSFIIRVLRHEKSGSTTEFAAIAAFLIGMIVYDGLYLFATFTTVIVIFILDIRSNILQLADKTTNKDLHSMVLFLLITFIILPILPNHTIDPYQIINPYFIWMMVVLISGLSFAGYIAARLIGVSRGIMVAGFFGGFLSSTATTITFSKKVDEQNKTTRHLASAIALACTTMYIRIIIVSAFIDIGIALKLLPAYLLATITGYMCVYYLYKHSEKCSIDVDFMYQNPLDLKEALKFGLLFGIVFGVTTLLKDWTGALGVYISSLLSGVSDVDAITLSLSTLYREGNLMLYTALIGIVIATFSNSLTKLAIAYTTGNKVLGNYLSIALGIPLTTIIIVLSIQELLL